MSAITLLDVVAEAMPDHTPYVNPRSRWDDAADVLALPELVALRDFVRAYAENVPYTAADEAEGRNPRHSFLREAGFSEPLIRWVLDDEGSS